MLDTFTNPGIGEAASVCVRERAVTALVAQTDSAVRDCVVPNAAFERRMETTDGVRMDTSAMNLIAELLALQRGQCVWCETGRRHPEYSQCAKHLTELDAVAPAGFDDPPAGWTEPTGDGLAARGYE